MVYFPEFIKLLLEADTGILLACNGFHSPLLDELMWMASDKWIWIPLYIILAMQVFRHFGFRQGIICMALIILMIAATDQTCASILKPTVCRLRPSSPDNPVSSFIHLVNGYHGGRYGFPSCHAANSFSLAVFLSLLFRNRKMTAALLGWTILVSYSRIYLGVHYPGDIIGGFIVGGFFALTFTRLKERAFVILRNLRSSKALERQ